MTVEGVEGLPLWALLLSVLLTSGGGAALWNLISARMSHSAVREVTASTANLNDVAALNSAITGLAGENSRLSKRQVDDEAQIEALRGQVDTLRAEVVVLRTELNTRPTKDDLKAQIKVLQDNVDKLRSQLTSAGIRPVNGGLS